MLKNRIALWLITGLGLFMLLEISQRGKELFRFPLCHPIWFVLNCLILLLFTTPILWAKRKYFALFACFAPIMTLVVVNTVLQTNRDTPLNGGDFRLSRLSMAELYTSGTNILLTGLLLLIIAVLAMIFHKTPKETVPYKQATVCTLSIMVLFTVVLCILNVGGKLRRSTLSLTETYKERGFAVGLFSSTFERGIEKPEHYSEAAVKEQMATLPIQHTVVPEDSPNLIFLHLESFIDVSHLRGLTMEYDSTPNFSALKRNHSSGKLSVSSIGAGSFGTELEVMTGFRMKDFGMGECPYETILGRKTCPSIPYALHDFGYATQAIHAHNGDFYNRADAFAHMGIERFTPLEYIQNPECNMTGWLTDATLVDLTIRALDQTAEKDYVYISTMQTHGPYPKKKVREPKNHIIQNPLTEKYDSFQYYIDELFETDAMLGALTEKLSSYPEKVMLVLYGDHQPNLSITQEMLTDLSVYQTEYVIWTNYPLPAVKKDIPAYCLGSYVLSLCGLEGTPITKLQQYGFTRKDFDTAQQMLEYDLLYGERYSIGEKAYPVCELQYGITSSEGNVRNDRGK